MTRPRISYSTLDRVLCAMEEEILRVTDDEILQDVKSAPREAQHVRTLIKRQLAAPSQPVPRGSVARRRWLAELLRVRPSLAPTLSATFGGRRAPSDSEINAVIGTLLKRGVLKQRKQ